MKQVAIIGSGIAGTTLAWHLAQRGHRVDIFEKGLDYPYPHAPQFQEKVIIGNESDRYYLPADLKGHTFTGDYPHDLEDERYMWTGGSATRWEALTPRMTPNDFRTKSLYGFGKDWPITYDELETYYGRAEAYLGVSGTDDDNPFAPKRSSAYPLPPFELSHDDQMLAERFRAKNIILHTTPQARTRLPYQDRAGCMNFGACTTCPIGARYSPTHHLTKLVSSGQCRLRTETSVRRIAKDESGRARAIVYRENGGSMDLEHPADVIILAAGALESPRLLLLSDGLGNSGGQVGKNLVFHHLWRARLRFKEDLFPGRIGAWTSQSQQFVNHDQRGPAGGMKIEFSSHAYRTYDPQHHWKNTGEILDEMRPMLRMRPLTFHAETAPGDTKYAMLSKKLDRFGDPLAHVHYASSEFDDATHAVAARLAPQFAEAAGASGFDMPPTEEYYNGSHHMGTCRMGLTPEDSVVNSFGQVHDAPNVYVLGSSIFSGCPGPMNPTLTLTALAIRTADQMLEQVLA